MTTDQTDHPTIADRLLRLAKDGETPTEHLLAALNDGQAEQTEWLHRIRDLLAVMAEPKGDPCPRGCPRDVEPEPVTVTLPREVVERAHRSLATAVLVAQQHNRGVVAQRFTRARDTLADALDAASAAQEADQ